jgi:ABC-type multidrug transport system fused ATPase/permease subunit
LSASFAESLGVTLIVLFLYSIVDRASEAALMNGVIGQVLQIATAHTGGGTRLALLIFAMVAASAVLTFAYDIINATARNRLSEAVRNRLHSQFLEVSYDFILRQDRGQLLNVMATEHGQSERCISASAVS